MSSDNVHEKKNNNAPFRPLKEKKGPLNKNTKGNIKSSGDSIDKTTAQKKGRKNTKKHPSAYISEDEKKINEINGKNDIVNNNLNSDMNGDINGDIYDNIIGDMNCDMSKYLISPENIDALLRIFVNAEIEKISVIEDSDEMTDSIVGLLEILIPKEIDRLRNILSLNIPYNDKVKHIRDLAQIHGMDYPARHKMIIVNHMIDEKLFKKQNIIEQDFNDTFKSYVTTYVIPQTEEPNQYNKNIATKRVIYKKSNGDPNIHTYVPYDLDFNFPDDIPDNITKVLKHGIETVIQENVASIEQLPNITLNASNKGLPLYKNVHINTSTDTISNTSDTKNADTKPDINSIMGKKINETTINNTNTSINVDLRGAMINDIQMEVNNNSMVRLYLVGRDSIHHLDRFLMSDIMAKSNDSTIIYFLRSEAKYPEYYDIYFPETKKKYVFKYDGSIWCICDTETINEAVYGGQITLNCLSIERFIKNLSDNEKDDFVVWMSEVTNTQVSKTIKNLIKKNYSRLLEN